MSKFQSIVNELVEKTVLSESAVEDFLFGGCDFVGAKVQPEEVMALYGYDSDYQGYQNDFWMQFGITKGELNAAFKEEGEENIFA